jgi:hypothetical protein
MAATIETLEARQLLSASMFGPATITRFGLTGEVAGTALVNDRIHLSNSGQCILAQIASTGITQDQTPGMIVRWGDGTAPLKTTTQYFETGQAFGLLSAYADSGGHVYRRPGKYMIQVQFTDKNKTIGKFNEVVHVYQNSPIGKSLSAKPNVAFSGTIGSFEVMPTLIAGNAQIDWGDGTTSTGEINQPSSDQPAAVSGSHTYKKAGVYRVAVTGTFGPTPSDDGGGTAAFVEFQTFYSTITARR